MEPSQEMLLEMYRRMVRIREFELAAIDLFKRGQVKGTIHAYIGMEASGRRRLHGPAHRRPDRRHPPQPRPQHRQERQHRQDDGRDPGQGDRLLQGPRRLDAHRRVRDRVSLGALAVVGSGIPLAVGAALGFKMQGKDRVAVPFTGDAGSNTGNWHESLNMAAVWKLPVVFVLENNHYGVSTRIEESTAIEDLSLRAQGYGMPGVRVDGFDVLAVYQAA